MFEDNALPTLTDIPIFNYILFIKAIPADSPRISRLGRSEAAILGALKIKMAPPVFPKPNLHVWKFNYKNTENDLLEDDVSSGPIHGTKR